MPTDLAVIIVTWNVRDLVLDALRTLCDDLVISHLDSHIYVVDNASTDGTPEAIRAQFPSVTVLAQADNLGFAAGNNIALRALGFCDQPTPNSTAPRAVLLLNPDTLVQPGAIRALYDALLSLPRVGVVGAQLAYADGSFQHSAFRFPGLSQLVIDLFPVPGRFYESRLNGRYDRDLYQRGAPFPVDHTLGATMLLRREVIEQTGLFDEQFFMYCEEVDWSMRIRQAGWEIYAVPNAHITHLEGKSASQIRPQSVINLWSSRLRLYTKHYSAPKLTMARWLVRLGMQRKIHAAQQDTTLTTDQREVMLAAYRQVLNLYSGTSKDV
ncbi:MAG: glycosyltransferase family 2 protein [Chloroflexota bacterium]